MKTQFRVLMLVAAFVVGGCQKSGTNGSTEVEQAVDSALSQKSCSEGPSRDVSIVGLENLKSGQKARLSLSEGVNCNDAKGALWKVGQTLVGSGQTIETEIKGSGNYVLSVEIPNQSKTMASQNKTGDSSDVLSVSAKITVTDSGVMVVGPQAGTADMTYSFSLAIPTGVQVTSAQWSFGDGSAPVSSLAAVSHTFPEGVYQMHVALTLADGKTESLQHQISLLPVPDGKYCPLDQLDIVGATEIPVGRGMDFSVNLSTCLKSVVTSVSWDFGDQSADVSGVSARHAFDAVGVYIITVEVNLGGGQSVSLIREVQVVDNLETMPGPTPAPNPNRCIGFGTTRVIDGNTSTEQRACGQDGMKEVTSKEQITQTCSQVGEGLEWVETSRTTVVVSEGACMGQSCNLITENGAEVLKNGESRTLYSSKSPVGSCQDVQSVRTCTNGVLSGSDTAKYLSCNAGCGDFGIHGTTVVGVVVGEVSVPVQCQWGETGVTSTYSQIADKSCNNGTVVTSNTRQGDIKTAGVCPVYKWASTDNWTACSADCGGEQARIIECRDAAGVAVADERCGARPSPEVRVCDGNPEAVAKSESKVTTEEAPSCATCPKNQIGVIVKERDVTTTVVTACVNHTIESSTVVTNGAWRTESYCRDLTPARCSQDSLSNDQAHARHQWMVKCQGTNPVIKEFLTQFEEVKYQGHGLDTAGRVLYPTFMSTQTKKPWIAPKTASASCTIPENVYVAGVCLSSCATPEQQILVERENKFKYMSFIDALTQNVPQVATLQSNSTMASKELASTKVDVWVTEMLDGDHDILIFNMKSGGQLKLTTNHPILTADGVMKISGDFKVGESLVQLGGKLDPIVSIEKAVHHGKVYNVFVKSSDLRKNVVVTNGYLNGTAFYQNEGAKFLNRAMFRENLFRGAFPEEKK